VTGVIVIDGFDHRLVFALPTAAEPDDRGRRLSRRSQPAQLAE
jgi:hypothetical protein